MLMLTPCPGTQWEVLWFWQYRQKFAEKDQPVQDSLASEVKELQRDDVACKAMLAYLEDGVLPGKWCLVVPGKMSQRLLHKAHGGRFAGHFGEKRVYDLLRRHYWWPGMRADVRRHCRACLVCASRKGTGCASRPPLQPIPVGGPFHRMCVDILKLPTSFEGKQYAVVFLNYLTKWAEVLAASDQTAQTVANLFVEGVVCRHGAPQELLSDRGPNFLSELFLEVCRLLEVKKVNTSGYHPQTA